MTTNHDRRSSATLWAGASALLTGLLLMLGLAVPTSAGATTNSIDLHNDTAEAESDCPADGAAYWHFVLAPNNGTAAFETITLNLTTETVTVSGDEIIPNGSQTDNVFVAVPAGHTLTDLVATGSSATYTGAAPSRFNLSHICEGTVPSSTTTTTTAPSPTSITAPSTTAPSTTSTIAPTTSTTAPTTTTTEAPTTTTTEAPTTTTTEAPTTTTTEAPTTTTTEAPTTTTTEGQTAASSTTPADGATTSTPDAGPAAVQAEVLGRSVSRTSGTTLPVTGGVRVPLLALGAALAAGGAVLLLVGRRRLSAFGTPQ